MPQVAPAFHYEDADHSYWLDDRRIPSATQLIEMGGLLGTAAQFYTEASRDRGTDVHALCTNYDLGVLNLKQIDSPNKGAALAYVAACQALKPEWENIEEAEYHGQLLFGCRPDRVGRVFKRLTVAEIKRAVKAKHHAVQTALQALAVSYRLKVPAEMIQRLCIYVKPTGRFSVEVHEDPRDFHTAHDLIRRFC